MGNELLEAPFQAEATALAQPSKRACRVNGPALFLLNRPDGQASNDVLLVGPIRAYDPLSGYDELILQARWKTVDPSHHARIDVLQAWSPDGEPKDEDFRTMLDDYDKEKSRIMAPLGWAAENQLILVYRNLTCSHFAVRMRARSPKGPVPAGQARWNAAVWCIMIGHETARVAPPESCGSMPAVWIGRKEYLLSEALAGCTIKVEDGRIWARMRGQSDWYDASDVDVHGSRRRVVAVARMTPVMVRLPEQTLLAVIALRDRMMAQANGARVSLADAARVLIELGIRAQGGQGPIVRLGSD